MAKKLMMLTNPRKRSNKRRKTPKKRAVARRAPRRSVAKRTTRRRYRRNPSMRGGLKGMMKSVTPALTGAAGAIGLDLLYGYIPVPVQFKSGPLRHVVKGAFVIAAASLLGKFVKGQTAATVAQGALTVIAHDLMKEQLGGVPGLKLGEYFDATETGLLGYASPAYTFNGANDVDYLSSDLDQSDLMGNIDDIDMMDNEDLFMGEYVDPDGF